MKPLLLLLVLLVPGVLPATAKPNLVYIMADGQGFDVNDTNGLGAGLNRNWYGNINVAETLTDAAIDFIGKHKAEPFFVYLCHWDVHVPLRARQAVVEKYKKKLTEGKWERDWNPLYLSGSAYNLVVPVHGTDRMYWRATPCSVIRKGDWKLIQFFESDSVELYNLAEDLGEKSDLSGMYKEKAAEMLGELRKWQADTRAVIPAKLNPDFDPKRKPKTTR